MTQLLAAFNQGGKFPTIGMINKATVSLGVDFDQLIQAAQIFLDQHFVPIWGYPATLVKRTDLQPNEWGIILMDDADVAGALGYHDLTVGGEPISKVFVKTILKYKEKVSVTVCHELCEMLIDPGIQLWADNGKGVWYAYEMCDAVEEDTFMVNGVEMSDFVYPSFFEPWHKKGSVKFDHLGHVAQPFQTLKGGYQIIMKNGRISNVFGSKAKENRFKKEDRRLHRSEYRRHVT